MKPKRSSFEDLPFRLVIFDEYQRDHSLALHKKLFREWKLDAVGVLTISIRGGKHYGVDGQHRIRVAMEKGLGDTKAKCHVYRTLTKEEEAQKFLELNDASRVSAVDRYRAGLIGKDPACIGVRSILAEYGTGIGSVRTDGYVRCVAEVFKLYDRDPALLGEVFSVTTEAWGTRAAALERVPVAALGLVLGHYNGQIDKGILTKKLAKYSGGPAALGGDARGLADYKPVTLTRAAAEIVVDTYNRGRRSGQLAPL